MRSSRGGGVEQLVQPGEPALAFSRAAGLESTVRGGGLCVDTTVWSSRSFSSAEISPGG